jgi:putative GTP pyrophosphokinase
VGYRSTHIICDLGDKRTSLPEYAPYKGLLFEIQIRTVLQHAWAEISHERNYKLAGVLPKHLERRLNLAAGNLETLDRELDAIASAIDKYRGEVAEKTDRGELEIGIDTTSLTEYLGKRFGSVEWLEKAVLGEEIIGELHDFGIKTIAELESILTPEVIQVIELLKPGAREHNYWSLLRTTMMYADIDRYFESSWKQHWNATDDSIIDPLSTKYGQQKVIDILKKRLISIESI